MPATFPALLDQLERLTADVARAASLSGDQPSERAMLASFLLHEAQTLVRKELAEIGSDDTD